MFKKLGVLRFIELQGRKVLFKFCFIYESQMPPPLPQTRIITTAPFTISHHRHRRGIVRCGSPWVSTNHLTNHQLLSRMPITITIVITTHQVFVEGPRRLATRLLGSRRTHYLFHLQPATHVGDLSDIYAWSVPQAAQPPNIYLHIMYVDTSIY
jgi:hypothetical protein